jgi:hypothetical protein
MESLKKEKIPAGNFHIMDPFSNILAKNINDIDFNQIYFP